MNSGCNVESARPSPLEPVTVRLRSVCRILLSDDTRTEPKGASPALRASLASETARRRCSRSCSLIIVIVFIDVLRLLIQRVALLLKHDISYSDLKIDELFCKLSEVESE